MSGYEDLVMRVGGQTADQVLALYAKLEAGEITDDEFVALAADLVAGANLRGASVSELVLRAYVEQATGRPVAGKAALRSQFDAHRLRTAVRTILASELDTEMQLRRLVTVEVSQASADAYGESLRRYPGISGWTRDMESGACQLCNWWWREGRVWAREHPMPRHKGCTCHQVPVIDGEVQSTGYTRKLKEKRNARV
ncbi:hypothetical protein [Tomitella fengzijianii]|uniref:hypothetical protein n=1 Tax=Tomitella fengzijianii TaxID=2597660 RepID=UPI00131C720C|nr:hypothetical protein [Tomitella fengzijianii]